MERDPRAFRNDKLTTVPLGEVMPVPSLLGWKGFKPANAAGRNHPCPCGSGKKYKHCCRRAGK
jgi:uncharacterized protein YecA (UPF0149 family)